MDNKLKFSGHESFNCRQIWLKKGFDFIKEGGKFNAPDAVIKLGVGKNMVSSIQHWLLAFGIIQGDKKTTNFSELILGDNGFDPFLENPATLWLLHYRLVSTNYASIYNYFFNEFKNENIEFTTNSLLTSLIQKCELENYNLTNNTLQRDINVFLRNYLKSEKNEKNLEDEYSGIFISNNMIEKVNKAGNDNFRVIINERTEIPIEIVLFLILDIFHDYDSISFYDILNNKNSVGNCFLINEDGFYQKILAIQDKYPNIVFKEDSGIKEIQIKSKIDKWEILREYYAK